jgi:hypothetical protein
MTFLFDLLFGCRHKRKTFPRGAAEDCYVACLDCGKHFTYDWSAMRIGEVR